MLIELRKNVGLRLVDLAEKMGIYQSWVTHMESGQRRIDVIELIELGRVIGFDPVEVMQKLTASEQVRETALNTGRRQQSASACSHLRVPKTPKENRSLAHFL